MRFKAGRNPDIRFMAHLWEPLRWIHFPLAVYVAAEGLWLASSLLLRVLGFRPFKHPSVSRPQSYMCLGMLHWIHLHLAAYFAAEDLCTTSSRLLLSVLSFRPFERPTKQSPYSCA